MKGLANIRLPNLALHAALILAAIVVVVPVVWVVTASFRTPISRLTGAFWF